jgi:organic radical activating enzyme
VCTGGEPLLQLDEPLIQELRQAGFSIAVETNGTLDPPSGQFWLTVSPKSGTVLRLTKGNELKLVYPQIGVEPEQFSDLEFDHFFLQPMDGPNCQANTNAALKYCLSHPQWRLGLQTHKIINIR